MYVNLLVHLSNHHLKGTRCRRREKYCPKACKSRLNNGSITMLLPRQLRPNCIGVIHGVTLGHTPGIHPRVYPATTFWAEKCALSNHKSPITILNISLFICVSNETPYGGYTNKNYNNIVYQLTAYKECRMKFFRSHSWTEIDNVDLNSCVSVFLVWLFCWMLFIKIIVNYWQLNELLIGYWTWSFL